MATDEPDYESMGFLTDTDIDDIFGREKAFVDELESQSLARLDWMLTKHRAAFLVLAHELGIDPSTAAKLSTAQAYLSRVFSDFVSTGIDAEHATPQLRHPLDTAFNGLIDEITEPSFEEAVETLGPISQRMTDLVLGADEDLLHKLEQLRDQA